jgi:hypothetical protein
MHAHTTFTIVTITYKVAVYAIAEWEDTLALFHLSQYGIRYVLCGYGNALSWCYPVGMSSWIQSSHHDGTILSEVLHIRICFILESWIRIRIKGNPEPESHQSEKPGPGLHYNEKPDPEDHGEE